MPMWNRNSIIALVIAISACGLPSIAAEEINIPGLNNSKLEDYLCPESGTITPHTELIIEKSQNISSGQFCLVENTTNITIKASTEVEVQCVYNTTSQQNSGFGFLNVNGLHIENVKFTNCGTFISSSALRYVNESTDAYYFGYQQKTVFLFNHCNDVHLSHVSISSYFGYAFIGVNLCGSIVLDNVEQCNNTRLSQYCTNADFSESGSGTFLYYTDTPISNSTCQGEDNLLDVGIVSKFNYNQCPYPNLQFLLRSNKRFPISSGSTFGLVHAQKSFSIVAKINLSSSNNNDTRTVGSSVIVFNSFHNDSSITLSGLYQENQGTQIGVYFRLNDTNLELPPQYYPLILENLTLVRNNLSFFSIAIEDALGVSSDFTVLVNNIRFQQNNQPKLLYVHSGDTSLDHGIQVEIENVSCSGNKLISSDSEIFGVLKFTNVRNVSVLSDTFISGDFVSPCVQIASSNIFLSGQNITFANGSAKSGGGLELMNYDSFLYLVEPVHVTFIHNDAMTGNAIYAADTLRYDVNPQEPILCTLQLITNSPFDVQNITQLNISVDILSNSHPSLYSSRLNTACESVQTNKPFIDTNDNTSLLPTTILNNHIFSFNNDEDAKLSFINGFCYNFGQSAEEGEKNCTWMDPGIIQSGHTTPHSEIMVSTHPGKEFLTVFYAYELSFNILEINNQNFWSLQIKTEHVSRSSSVREYSLSISLLNMSVFPEGETDFHLGMYQSSYGWVNLAKVQVTQCPPGFTLQGNYSQCGCVELLAQKDFTCDANTALIDNPSHSTSAWVGYDNGVVYFASECPPDHCKRSSKVDLSIPNNLCDNDHSGKICGVCAPGFSAVFGSDVCWRCSNAWFLTIFLYAISGVFFVFVLFALNLTVTSGTICGLVIYSNILNLTTHIILAEVDDINPIPLRAFVAFLNLDLGFPVCFYDGMTTSVKYGLQFLYPLYLWLIVIILIVACKFSMRLANKLGSACLKVLATLLFFSYSKILSNVYSILTFQTLHFQSNNSDQVESEIVWLADGQSYTESHHVALVFFAVVFTALFLLPFTMLLTFSFFFIRFRIVNRFIPLIDAYCGPFLEKFRFWFGVRLWVIETIFLLYTILINYSLTAVFFSHSIVVGGLIVVQAFLKPFRCSVCRLLDLYYLINYWLICITCLYLPLPENLHTRTAVVAFLVSCSFVVFIGILVYQFYQVTKNTKFQKIIKAKISKLRKNRIDIEKEYVSLKEESSVSSSERKDSRSSSASKLSQVVYDPRHFRDSILDSVNIT